MPVTEGGRVSEREAHSVYGPTNTHAERGRQREREGGREEGRERQRLS